MNAFKTIFSISIIGFIERFSFYMVLGVLFLFMTSTEIGVSNANASKLYGFFLNSIYYLPIILGLIADLTNRRVVLGIGISFMIIGYSLLYFLSGSIPGLYISLGIIALGLSAYKPNIWILVGDTAIKHSDNRLALQGFLIFSVAVSLGSFLSNFFASYISINYGYLTLFIISSVLLIICIVIYFVLIYPEAKPTNYIPKHNNKFSLLISIFIVFFFLNLGLRQISDVLFKTSDINDILRNGLRDFFLLILSLFVFGLLFLRFLKIIKSNIKTLLSILLISITLTLIFFMYCNFNIIGNVITSDYQFVLITLVMVILEILLLPIIRFLIYLYSFRFKGLAYGLFFAQFPIISRYILKFDLGPNNLVLISAFLLIMIIGLWLIFYKRQTTLPNNAYSK